jgi:hypothetical protein
LMKTLYALLLLFILKILKEAHLIPQQILSLSKINSLPLQSIIILIHSNILLKIIIYFSQNFLKNSTLPSLFKILFNSVLNLIPYPE